MRQWLAYTVLVCGLTICAKADTFVVLPFFNVSKSANLDWIGESLSESIHEALASGGLLALDREERAQVYRRLAIRPEALLTRASVIKIADSLGAAQVIFGQFELKPPPAGQPASRGALEITARLVDLKRTLQGPEFGESGSLEDLAALQRHLSWQTLQFVLPETAPSEADFSSRHPVIRLDAMESYIRGLLASSAEEKHRLFTRAARLDQAFSQPCFQLGRLHFQKKEYKVAAEWLGKVSSSDVHFREASFLSGLCLYNAGDFSGAQNAFQTVAATVPLNEVYNNIGAAQSRQNLPEAIDSFKKALEGDPSDPAYQFNVGYALWRRAGFDAAAERFRAALERDPQDAEAGAMLERCLKRNGPRTSDTKSERLERLKTNYEESAWWQLKAALQPEKP